MIDRNTLMAIGTPSADADKWVPWLNMTMARYEIDSAQRQAMFLAQLAHESGSFRHVTENLNYSAEALRRVFKKYFPTDEVALEYARKPEKIANRVYANRMGNGDEASGEGWKYRGRGLIQLTGKNNYASFSLKANNNALLEPDLVAEPELAALSAGWFWDTNDLNKWSDTGDVKVVRRRVNGGFNGLEDCQTKYDKLIVILGES